jgi:hypothetical protein
MEILNIALTDWVTIVIIIAQAGVMYYRLKKVEQRTDLFNELMIEFAVHKKTLELHREESEKQSSRTEIILQRLDTRLSSIETQALRTLMQHNTI